MADPVTPNVGLAVPIRGSDVGIWDIPVNGDFTLIDNMFGGITTLALSSNPVTLTTSQAQVGMIALTGTLNANVSITLPSIYKVWTIHNQLTNSPSSFCATLVSTSGASIIGLPPSTQDVFYDGVTLRYKQLDKIGAYWDYAGTTVPTWVTASTIPPYLNCNGTSFSSATYPVLANLLGTNILPDARGRNRYALNQTTSRLTSTGAGIDGNTAYAAGGTNGAILLSGQIPSITSANAAQTITVYPAGNATNFVPTSSGAYVPASAGGGAVTPYVFAPSGVGAGTSTFTAPNSIVVSYVNGSPNPVPATTPGYVGGITMIRA